MQKTHREASKFESPHRVQRRRDLGFSLIMSQHMVNCWIKDQTEWQNQTYCTETIGFDPKKVNLCTYEIGTKWLVYVI